MELTYDEFLLGMDSAMDHREIIDQFYRHLSSPTFFKMNFFSNKEELIKTDEILSLSLHFKYEFDKEERKREEMTTVATMKNRKD